MTTPRKPATFRIPDAEPLDKPTAPRAPRSARPDAIVVETQDVFAEPDAVTAPPPPAVPRGSRSWLGRTFFAGMGMLVSLAVGLWVDGLIRDLFARNDWLGWAAAAAAAVAFVALLLIILRELAALRRLASVEHMRARADVALARGDQASARRIVDELSGFVAARPETVAGRRHLAELRDDIIDGPDLLRLAEVELLVPLDQRAQTLVLDAAKRVSLVTAVSPRAVVDIFYVMFEASRLIRRVSELYGARPGALGFVRLVRSVMAHLAITGSIAMGDSLVQQLVGQGLAARLSAKLGEGVVNGMMTARIGLAAIDAARPLPFAAVRRPGIGDFLSALTRFSAAQRDPETTIGNRS